MGLDTTFCRISKEAFPLMEKYECDKYIRIQPEEVAYFRKFWSLLNRFDYGDETYGKWVEVPMEKIAQLRNEAKQTILKVEDYLRDGGHVINRSPLERVPLEGDCSKWLDKCISLQDVKFTDDIESECDNVCNSVYEEPDAFLFRKVVTLYQKFSDILENTDFDKEVIIMESDW